MKCNEVMSIHSKLEMHCTLNNAKKGKASDYILAAIVSKKEHLKKLFSMTYVLRIISIEVCRGRLLCICETAMVFSLVFSIIFQEGFVNFLATEMLSEKYFQSKGENVGIYICMYIERKYISIFTCNMHY